MRDVLFPAAKDPTMTNIFALSVPTDISWRRIGAHGDMHEVDLCDLGLPPRPFTFAPPTTRPCALSRASAAGKRPPATLAHQGEAAMLRRVGMGFAVLGMLLAGGCESCDRGGGGSASGGEELCGPLPKGPACPQGYSCKLSDEFPANHPKAFGTCVKDPEYQECSVVAPCNDGKHHGCVAITPPLCDSQDPQKFCSCDGFYPDGKPKEPDDKVPESPTTGSTTTK